MDGTNFPAVELDAQGMELTGAQFRMTSALTGRP